MGVKAFLRGGYLGQEEPVLVVRHAEPYGLWVPFKDGRPTPINEHDRAELRSLLGELLG